MATALATPTRHNGTVWMNSVDTVHGPVRVTSHEQPDGTYVHKFASRHVRGRVYDTKLKMRNHFPLEYACACPGKTMNGTCFHGKAANDVENIIAESKYRHMQLHRGSAHNGEDLDDGARRDMGYEIGVVA